MSFSKPVNVQAFIEAQKKTSTINATKQHINIVNRYLLDEHNEMREIQDINAEELDNYLSQFFVVLKKQNGTDYEPASIDCFKASIERTLKDNYYPWSIINDREFTRTRASINAKKIHLKKLGLGRKRLAAEPISPDDEEKLLAGQDTPTELQFSIFYAFTKGFGLRGRDEHRNMRFGDVQVKTTTDGVQFLELSERNSKTMDGTKKDDYRQTTPKIFATKTINCPVELFGKFIERRPACTLLPDSPMYLTPIPQSRIGKETSVWYYRSPMGINTLGNLVKEMCNKRGIQGHITNHSIRKTCVKSLSDAGIQAHKIIKITGHKNVQSLQHYDRELSTEEHQKLSKILTSRTSTCSSTETNATAPPPHPPTSAVPITTSSSATIIQSQTTTTSNSNMSSNNTNDTHFSNLYEIK